LDLYAEENSLDDTMYYLGEALRQEKIELDVFLKVWIYLFYTLLTRGHWEGIDM
jgi:hypothetical protein